MGLLSGRNQGNDGGHGEPPRACDAQGRGVDDVAGGGELLRIISRRLSEGTRPMSFDEFMDIALYWPGLGYYTRGEADVGPEGDFLTCPSCHPIFSKLLAKQFMVMWRTMGRPRLFTILEVGGGGGDMAREVLTGWEELMALTPRAARPVSRFRYVIVERSETLRQKQMERLSGVRTGFELQWYDSLASVPDSSVAGVIVSNELFTALPFHVIENTDEGPREVAIVFEGGRIRELLIEIVTRELREEVEHLTQGAHPLGPGHRIEVCLRAKEVVREFARILDRGFVLTIDYGARREELVQTGSRFGSMRCYYRHRMNREPYERIGLQDITADLDFDIVIEEGERVGLNLVGYLEQWRFLLGLGILEEISRIEGRLPQDPSADFELSPIIGLFSPESRGALFKVLIQSKGVRSSRIGRPGAPSDLGLLASRGGPVLRAVVDLVRGLDSNGIRRDHRAALGRVYR